ncbi:MAG: magnesium transporter [Fervidicoccaceae archaeon]
MAPVESLSERLKRERGSLKESLFSMSIAVGGEVAYSAALVSARGLMLTVPTIPLLIPVLAQARGGVYSSIASSTSTRLHFGLGPSKLRDPWVASRLLAASLVLLMVSLAASIFIYVGTRGLVGFAELLYASSTSLLLANFFLFPFTLLLAVWSFRRGWNPDNVMAPILMLMGDVATVPTLIAVVLVLHRAGALPAALLALLTLALSAVFVIALKEGRIEGALIGEALRSFTVQNGGAVLLSVLIEAAAGVVLEKNVELVAAYAGVLGTLPVMMQRSGALACITASRMSTGLHLGTYPSSIRPRGELVDELLRNLLLGLFGYAVASCTGMAGAALSGAHVDVIHTLIVLLLVALVLTPMIPVLAHIIAVTGFRLGLDPDNFSLPTLAALMDLLTISSIVAVLKII